MMKKLPRTALRAPPARPQRTCRSRDIQPLLSVLAHSLCGSVTRPGIPSLWPPAGALLESNVKLNENVKRNFSFLTAVTNCCIAKVLLLGAFTMVSAAWQRFFQFFSTSLKICTNLYKFVQTSKTSADGTLSEVSSCVQNLKFVQICTNKNALDPKPRTLVTTLVPFTV